MEHLCRLFKRTDNMMKSKLLILDIDETLIYASPSPLERQHDFVVGNYFVYTRPYLRDFLRFCFQNFNVGIWTSSTELYAEKILQEIIEVPELLKFVFCRSRCVRKFDFKNYEDQYIKDLRKVKKLGYKLEEIIVVDDTPSKFQRHYENLVIIDEWLGCEKDSELLHLQTYLLYLNGLTNIRKEKKRLWKNFRHNI